MIDEDGLLVSFVEESQEHLQSIEPDLLELEQGGSSVDYEVLNRIFRSIHSIKGASGFFGLKQIGELSHIMESLLSQLRDGKITTTPELTDALLAGVDALRTMVEDVAASEEIDIQKELDTLQVLFETVAKPSGKVTVKEKQKPDKPKEVTLSYEIDKEEIKSLILSGKYLYSVRISLKEDFEKKDKTPYDYINSIASLGQFVDSFLDTSKITGLADCKTNDISFNFIFSTVLDPDLISVGLEVPEERISHYDIENIEDFEEIKETKISQDEESPPEKEKEPPAEDKTTEPAEEEKKKKAPAESKKKADTVQAIKGEEKLRVGINLLNDLVNLAGELVLGRNQLNEISAPLLKKAPGLNTVLQHVSHVTTEMQEKIMQLRMQPVSVIFGKFHRIVRDLSKNLKKEIALETYGEEVELDKSIIESLSDPLTHIIRNSADHGIELPDEREKNGKPRQGKITLNAFHEGGQIHLVIKDDGKGINTEVVGRKAVERGLITPDQLETMSERDLIKLVTRPGFSTVEKVSAVSGRGVGMDVVITNIERLGGTLEIDSTLNEGTTIRLILPLTLAIVSGLVIKAWGQIFILPEVNIDEMVRIKPEEISERIDRVQSAHILRLRDMLIPLISLREVLAENNNGDYWSNMKNNTDEPLRILILKYGASRIGLIVDSVENMEEIVVKPLPVYLKKMKCFSGASIMGNGKVALILDIGGIVEKSSIKDIEKHIGEKKEEVEEISSEENVQTLLIFDNGTEERFALPLELITRIERISASKIETIKDRMFFQYQGENLQLVFLEEYLPINHPDRESIDNYSIIIPKMVDYPIGIVMNRIIDTVTTTMELDTSTMMGAGLFGSAVIEGKITLLIDMFSLLEIAAPEWHAHAERTLKKRGKKKQILLVEDIAFFRMVETEYLESAGYEVVQAEDGRRALNILSKKKFDAVVLDIIMPNLDGWGVIKAIREDERLKDIPVIALTSLGDEENAEKGLEAGFDDWEAKLNKTSLLRKLDNLINKQ